MCLHQKGFTLLELLISISLTTILMTVLVVGMNLITRDWERNNKVLEQKLDESLLLLQIEKAILGTFPYSYKENTISAEKIFFNATETELKWASTVSPNRSSGLTLWHIKVQEEGGISLSVSPAYPESIDSQVQKTGEPSSEDSFKEDSEQALEQSIYFKNYKVSLAYLIEDEKKIKDNKQWSKTWEEADKRLPLGIKINFAPDDQEDEQQSRDAYELFAFIRAQPKKGSSAFGGHQRTGLMRQRK